MEPKMNEWITTRIEGWRDGLPLMEKLFLVAQPGALFSEPVSVGDRTIITASEVSVGLAFGYGAGGGAAPAEAETGAEGSPAGAGMGGGGGGGGGAFGRPVAAIIIDERGARVEPVVDVTKISLAVFTMFGSFAFMLSRMRRDARD